VSDGLDAAVVSDRDRRESRPVTPLILLTGATGYIGGRLLKALEQAGHRVRCLARRPEFLSGRVAASTEIVAGDVIFLDRRTASLPGESDDEHGMEDVEDLPF
jgi:nucleoside-diphosphate-sugar epimerase